MHYLFTTYFCNEAIVKLYEAIDMRCFLTDTQS